MYTRHTEKMIITIALVLILVIIILFVFTIFSGAPFVPTHQKELRNLFNELSLPKHAVVVDLGSGDGRVLRLAALAGYQAIGYELNPILWLVSKINLRKYPGAKVYLKSFWQADVSTADLVFTFQATRYMGKLERMLMTQMKKGSYFASYVFALPNMQIVKKTNTIKYYQF